jgi:hypothetical protein
MVPAMDQGAPPNAQRLPPPPPFSAPDPAQRTPYQAALQQNGAIPAWAEAPPKRAGELTPAWRLAFGMGWAAVIVGYAAVWETSRIIGLSTWWLGADAQPRLLVIKLLPFVGPIMVTGAAAANWRYLPFLGIVAAAAGAAIGGADFDRVRWISVVELVVAGAALLISVASFAGMYRRANSASASASAPASA